MKKAVFLIVMEPSIRILATLTIWLKNPPAGIDLSSLDIAYIDLWSHYRDAIVEVFDE